MSAITLPTMISYGSGKVNAQLPEHTLCKSRIPGGHRSELSAFCAFH